MGLANGNMGWFRLKANELDDDSDDSVNKRYARLDGACGVTSGEARFAKISVVAGATSTVQSAKFTMQRGV